VNQGRGCAESVAGLMIMAGAMAVVGAILGGLALGIKDYFVYKDSWSAVLGISVMASSAVVGSILVWGGLLIAKRFRKLQNKNSAD
jgi:uncharacterized membrane protein